MIDRWVSGRTGPGPRAALGGGAALLVLLIWMHTPVSGAFEWKLTHAFDLDGQRAQIVSALVAAFFAGLAGTLMSRSVLAGWLGGALSFALFAALPLVLDPGIRLLPGESILTGPFERASLALAVTGFVPAFAGATAGMGMRAALAAVSAMRGQPKLRWLGLVAPVALTAVSAYGLMQLPGILTYGPWDGVTAFAPIAAAQAPDGAGSSPTRSSPMRAVVFSYWSRVFKERRNAVVILPAGYDTPPLRSYPALYTLHGDPGGMNQWTSEGVAGMAAQLAALRRLPPLVIVSPDGNGPRGRAEDHWADSYVPGDLMETDLLDELMPAVEAHFRVVADRAHRMVAGLSSGGYGAANLALRHPGLFAVAVDAAGDLVPDKGAFGGSPALLAANEPLRLAEQPRPLTCPAFFVGWADDSYAWMNRLFAQRLKDSGYRLFTAAVTGGHSWPSFRLLLWDGLDSAGRLLAGPEVIRARS